MVGGSLRVPQLLPPLIIGRHDIAEILLKVALSTKKSINVFIQDLGAYKHKTACIVFT